MIYNNVVCPFMNELSCADGTSYFRYSWVQSDTNKYTRVNSEFLSSISTSFNFRLDSLPAAHATRFKDFKFYIYCHGLKHVIPRPSSLTPDSPYSACSFPFQYVKYLLQHRIDVSSIDPRSSWIDVAYCLKYSDPAVDTPLTLLAQNFQDFTSLFMCGDDINTVTIRHDPFCMMSNTGGFKSSVPTTSPYAKHSLVSMQVYSPSKTPFFKRGTQLVDRHTHTVSAREIYLQGLDKFHSFKNTYATTATAMRSRSYPLRIEFRLPLHNYANFLTHAERVMITDDFLHHIIPIPSDLLFNYSSSFLSTCFDLIKYNYDHASLPRSLDYSLSTSALLCQLASSVASRPPSFSFQRRLFQDLLDYYAPSSTLPFFPSLFVFSTHYETFLSSFPLPNLGLIFNPVTSTTTSNRNRIRVDYSPDSFNIFTAPPCSAPTYDLYHNNLFPSAPRCPNIIYTRDRVEAMHAILNQDNLDFTHLYQIANLVIGGIFAFRLQSTRQTTTNSRNPPFINPNPFSTIQARTNTLLTDPIYALQDYATFVPYVNLHAFYRYSTTDTFTQYLSRILRMLFPPLNQIEQYNGDVTPENVPIISDDFVELALGNAQRNYAPFATLVERTAFLYALFRYPAIRVLYEQHYNRLLNKLGRDINIFPLIKADRLWHVQRFRVTDANGSNYKVTKYAICFR